MDESITVPTRLNRRGGRPRSARAPSAARVLELRAAGTSWAEISRVLRCHPSAARRAASSGRPLGDPYYADARVTLYQGDALQLLPLLPHVDAVVTDPVWPNALASLAGAEDPAGLFAQAAQHFPVLASRLVVILGCMSDPRFLASTVPPSLPFVRTCYLRYAVPSYCGTLLNSGDVAYVFGHRKTNRGKRVLPGEVTANSPHARDAGAEDHPCPRKLEHLVWLMEHFVAPGGTVLDPFGGSGTTAVAAARTGRRAIVVELEENFCASMARRFADEARRPVLPLDGVS